MKTEMKISQTHSIRYIITKLFLSLTTETDLHTTQGRIVSEWHVGHPCTCSSYIFLCTLSTKYLRFFKKERLLIFLYMYIQIHFWIKYVWIIFKFVFLHFMIPEKKFQRYNTNLWKGIIRNMIWNNNCSKRPKMIKMYLLKIWTGQKNNWYVKFK